MNPVSQDVKDMLEGAGLATFAATSGWGLYVGQQPDQPDDVITVYEGPDASTADPDNDLYNPTVQVRLRGTDYLATLNKALAVRDELLKQQLAVTVNGTYYLGFWSQGGLNPLGRDEQDRVQFTMSFALMREGT